MNKCYICKKEKNVILHEHYVPSNFDDDAPIEVWLCFNHFFMDEDKRYELIEEKLMEEIENDNL